MARRRSLGGRSILVANVQLHCPRRVASIRHFVERDRVGFVCCQVVIHCASPNASANAVQNTTRGGVAKHDRAAQAQIARSFKAVENRLAARDVLPRSRAPSRSGAANHHCRKVVGVFGADSCVHVLGWPHAKALVREGLADHGDSAEVEHDLTKAF